MLHNGGADSQARRAGFTALVYLYIFDYNFPVGISDVILSIESSSFSYAILQLDLYPTKKEHHYEHCGLSFQGG